MSTSVSVYIEGVPQFDGDQLVVDEAVRISPPIGAKDRAKWCRLFAAVLAAEADRQDVRHREQQEALASLQAEVERLQAMHTTPTEESK